MPEASIRVVDVYPYRQTGDGHEFLLLRRGPNVPYAGQWRMVGGKIEENEAAWETGLREVDEETGHTPTQFWTLPSLNTFYEWQDDCINLIPAFAASLPGDPELDAEHDAFAWLSLSEATDRLHWPEQERLLRLTARLLQTGIPPRLIIELERE